MDERPTVTPISPGYRQPPQRRSPFLGCVAAASAVGLALSLLLNFALLGSRAGGLEQGPASFHEKVVEGEGDDKVVVIRVEGIIAEKAEGGLFASAATESLPKRIKDQLERAAQDAAVKAVILDVDSPGGTVTASDEIWNYLVKFRDSSKKPLVVHQGSLAASGGYYISAAGDEIVCEPTTITGSIGVIMQGLNFADFLHEHGIKDVSITSGPNKDLLSPLAPVRDAHVAILKAMVDDMYARFCDVVAQGIAHRTGKKAEDVLPDVKAFADGRVFTAKQAVELHLADKVGYVEDAFSEARARANIQKARLVKYSRQPSLLDALSGNADTKLDLGKGISIRVDARLLDELSGPRFLMLWRGE